MLNSADEMGNAFRGTVLEAREVRTVRVPETGLVGFEIDVADDEVHAAWRVARDLVERTGRWPLATLHNGAAVYDRSFYADGQDPSPSAVIARAQDLRTMDDILRSRYCAYNERYYHAEWDRIVGLAVDETECRIGRRPSASEVAAHVGPPDHVGLERFLFEVEESVKPATEREATFTYHDTIRNLVFLPTALSEESAAFVSYWACSGGRGRGHETLVAAMRIWKLSHEAELVINGGITLEFHVARPPVKVSEAFDLAVQLSSFGLPDGSLREHARDLLGRSDWYLQERP